MAPHFVDDDRHLRAAIDHALNDRQQAAAAELTAITRKGSDRTFRLWQALAETAIYPLRHQPAGHGPRYGLAVFDQYAGTDMDDLPAPVRIASQFLMAQATGDRDALETVYLTPVAQNDTAVLDGALGVLLDAAVESARTQQAVAAQGQQGARLGVPRGSFGA
jgi:hypothetical protein